MGAKPRFKPTNVVRKVALDVRPLRRLNQQHRAVHSIYMIGVDPRCGAMGSGVSRWESVTCPFCLLAAPPEHQVHKVHPGKALDYFMCGAKYDSFNSGWEWDEVTCADCLRAFYAAELSAELVDAMRVVVGNALVEAVNSNIRPVSHSSCVSCYDSAKNKKKRSEDRCLNCIIARGRPHKGGTPDGEGILAKLTQVPLGAAEEFFDGFDNIAPRGAHMYRQAYRLGQKLRARYGHK